MTSIDETAAAIRPDWGIEPPPARLQGVALAVLIPTAVVATLVGLLWSLAAGLVTLVVLVAVVVAVVFARTRSVLRSAGARLLGGDDGKRLVNLVEGLATANRLPLPGLWVIERGGPNAVVAWAHGPQMAVTRSLLDSYTRTELEAVVAHCLVRLGSGEARRVAYRCALGLRGEPGSVKTVDGNAVAITRYPPGLIGAIFKAEPVGGAFSALWLVGAGATHPDIADRCSWLADL